MKLLNDFCTGELAGTIGFFGSKMRGVPLYSQTITGWGMSILALSILYKHPYFKIENQNHITTLIGTLIPFGFGLLFEYGFGAPDYVVNPLLLTLSFFIHAIASARDTPLPYSLTEVKQLVRIAADLTDPESTLRELTLVTTAP